MSNEVMIKQENGLPEIKLTTELVRQYFCPKATDTEIMMFMKLCEYQKLNPWLREAYLIKYSDKMPASMVTGKETFLKRAYRHPRYRGHKAWVTGEHPNEMKGHAEVYVEGYKIPITIEVDYCEYVGKKRDFKTQQMVTNQTWAGKPKTMLRKVALVQALREAFPEELGGLYSEEEINTFETDDLSKEEVKVKTKDDVVQESTDEAVEEELARQEKKTKKSVKGEEVDAEFEDKIKPETIKSINVLAGKLWGKDYKEAYHEKLFEWTGKDSTTKLTFEEGENVNTFILTELNNKLKTKKG